MVRHNLTVAEVRGYGARVTVELTLVNKALCEDEPPPSTEHCSLPGFDRPGTPGHPDVPLRFE